MKIKTRAKLNLYLKVLGKISDGYHEINSIMSEFDWGDYIYIEKSEFDSFQSNMITDGENLAEKALRVLREHTFVPSVSIKLEKLTPIGSGLGTGSSDAAEVLKGLNKLFYLGLTNKNLCEIASKIGMDVPFFIDGGIQLATGRGDILKKLPGKKTNALVVMDEPVISKNIYSLLNAEDFLSDNKNTLLNPVLRNYEAVRNFYYSLLEIDKNFSMTGAGGAFFVVGEKNYLAELEKKIVYKLNPKFIHKSEILLPEVDYGEIIFNT